MFIGRERGEVRAMSDEVCEVVLFPSREEQGEDVGNEDNEGDSWMPLMV